MITLRQDQRTAVDKAKVILANFGVVYLAAQVRTGKNFMSFSIAKESGWKRVCIVSKLKAIIGIVKDYESFGNGFEIFTPTNFEQAHKIKLLCCNFDGFIIDESHANGAFPKPSKRTKVLKEIIGTKPVILMSGTPSPESLAQLYHQFFITSHGPWQKYKSFYRWSDEYVNKKQKIINGFAITEYKHAKEAEVQAAIRPYMVNLSQAEAGFTSFVDEEIIRVPIDSRIYRLMDVLKKDKVYKMQCGDYIVADSPVKMQSLYHQLSSGTVIATNLEQTERKYHILDESKAWFIKSKFAGQKIAIYYQFIKEGELLRRIFPDHTDNPDDFNNRNNLTFICQIVSGREGVNLSTADSLVMYNIAFSATSYWQVRARMQVQGRTKASKLYWIFSEKGIESAVYKAVVKKKSFTLNYFKKEYGIR